MTRSPTGNEFCLKIYLSRENPIHVGIVDVITTAMKAQNCGRSAAAAQILTVGWLAFQGKDVTRVARDLKAADRPSTQQLLEALLSSAPPAKFHSRIDDSIMNTIPMAPMAPGQQSLQVNTAPAASVESGTMESVPSASPRADARMFIKFGR